MFLTKLGTVLNTVGSLGVGYYMHKYLDMFTEGFVLEVHYPLYVSAIILFVGIVLRLRDIVSKKENLEYVNDQCDIQRGDNESLQEEVIELEVKLTEQRRIVEAALEVILQDRLPALIDERISNHFLVEAEAMDMDEDLKENIRSQDWPSGANPHDLPLPSGLKDKDQ